uniref:Uncharacterized protein n=1 Tax=Anguilla anguilla TaxID=7936 RepID=A0A0E9UZ03_ANGAN
MIVWRLGGGFFLSRGIVFGFFLHRCLFVVSETCRLYNITAL